MKNLLLITVFSLLFVPLFSQKIVHIKDVKGSYIIPPQSDISMKQAFEKAVNEAKLEALRKAGVAENIASSDILTTNQSNTNFKQELSSILSVELYGAVLNDSIVEQKNSNDQFGNIVVNVTLDVDVIKYEYLSDPSFDFKVEGVKEFYENEDLMCFSFTPYSNGYLRIFNVNDAENYVIYPFFDKSGSYLNDEPNRLFTASTKVAFPINKNMGNPNSREEGYWVSTNMPKERNFLIFVFTKENIPFNLKPTYKNILSWIYRITPDKRKVKFYDFIIVNGSAPLEKVN